MDNTSTETTRLTNIEIIRCFAIISLVAWHSICVYVGWSSSLPNIAEAVEGNLLTKIYIYASKILMPDANMPLFVIVAAYVYAYLWHKGAYKDTKLFFQKKIKRLIVPYFVLGTLVVLTIAEGSPKSILTGDAHHLWFCAMLFWCFVMIRLYKESPPPIGYLLIIGGLILQYHPITYDVLGIIKGLKYFPYFLFGFYLYSYKPRFMSLKRNKLLAILIWPATLVLYLKFKRVEPMCYAYCFMIFVLTPEDIHVPTIVKKISTYSFGIYVFHEWFIWNIAHIKKLHPIIIEHQFLYPLIIFVLILCVSYYLTKLALKTSIGRFLLT